MRNMSFALTRRQFEDGSKDVTRRMGWKNLKPGDHVMAVVKSMGLRKGEKVQRLGAIEIVSNRPEALCNITDPDVIREGFPDMRAFEFVVMFCQHMKCKPYENVNRIEFRKLNHDGEVLKPNPSHPLDPMHMNRTEEP